MKTIKQIAKELKINDRTVAYRFEKEGITGKKRILTNFYTQEQINKISYKKNTNPSYPELSNNKYYQIQIDILYVYFMLDNKTAAEVSRILEMPIYMVERTIRFYKERDCLIIQSKMNQ